MEQYMLELKSKQTSICIKDFYHCNVYPYIARGHIYIVSRAEGICLLHWDTEACGGWPGAALFLREEQSSHLCLPGCPGPALPCLCTPRLWRPCPPQQLPACLGKGQENASFPCHLLHAELPGDSVTTSSSLGCDREGAELQPW